MTGSDWWLVVGGWWHALGHKAEARSFSGNGRYILGSERLEGLDSGPENLHLHPLLSAAVEAAAAAVAISPATVRQVVRVQTSLTDQRINPSWTIA